MNVSGVLDYTIIGNDMQMVEIELDPGEGVRDVTFVPDGEPTPDLNLGKAIDLLTRLGMKIAVMSNASLL